MIKNYNVTLDHKTVERAKAKLKKGEKLSPRVNKLLEDWVNQGPVKKSQTPDSNKPTESDQ